MTIRDGKPSFKTHHIEPLWSNVITSLKELKDIMPDSVLVAFDIEGAFGTIKELGLAMLTVTESTPRFGIGRRHFFEDNNVQAFTIDIRDRPQRHYEVERHGQTICIENGIEAGPAMEKILKDFQGLGKRKFILIGYAMATEMKWISGHYPAVAQYFSAWVDVQQLIATQCDAAYLGLTNALQALNIIDNRNCARRHSAANDAIRALTILAGLLAGKTLATKPKRDDWVKIHRSLPSLKSFGPWTRYPFAVRVSAVDGSFLPDITLKDLVELFASYNLKAVGMNEKNRVRRRILWAAFHTVESLRDFIMHVEDEGVGGKRLKVIVATGLE